METLADKNSTGVTRACRQCLDVYLISKPEQVFLNKMSPRINGFSIEIPMPTLCPSCRLQRRLAHRNQIYVALRKELGSEAKSFSMYLGEPRVSVLSNEEWWDEVSWNPEDHGRPFDFSRSFFEQWQELRDSVPRCALNTVSGTIENSDYCNNALSLKDCYFCFDADRSRECLYVETLADCTDCLDCTSIVKCELCFDCTGCTDCYNLQASDDCVNCSDSWYLSDCKSCSDCFGCVNLRHAKYCVFNKQLNLDEFQKFVAGSNLASWEKRSKIEEKFRKFCGQCPRAHMVASRAENCTGNHIHNSRNIVNGYQIHNGEDLWHCDIVKSGGKNCHDCTISFVDPELMYECAICGLGVFNLAFCYNCWDGAADLLYCDTSHGSKNCFGCVCLRKRRYCVLNQQYSEGDYNSLVPRIIDHMRETEEWGEFFPMESSLWPYNVSLASRYFPLSERQAEEAGLNWLSKDIERLPTRAGQDLPDGPPESDTPIVTQCAASGKIFRITSQEIRRLRRFAAPLPRKAYDERMNDRAVRCGGVRLIERSCDRTGEKLRTVYTPAEAPILWRKDVFDRHFE